MTTLQVQYANYLENKRHNVQGEKLTKTELKEVARHNKESEKLTKYANKSGRISAKAQKTSAKAQKTNAETNAGKLSWQKKVDAAKISIEKTSVQIQKFVAKTQAIHWRRQDQLAGFRLQFDKTVLLWRTSEREAQQAWKSSENSKDRTNANELTTIRTEADKWIAGWNKTMDQITAKQKNSAQKEIQSMINQVKKDGLALEAKIQSAKLTQGYIKILADNVTKLISTGIDAMGNVLDIL